MKPIRVVLLFAACFFASLPVTAATFVVPEDDALAAKAELIIVGDPVNSYTQIASYGGIETVTEFDVRETLKGNAGLGRLSVHEPGGELNGRVQEIFGSPRFHKGKSVLLFLVKTPQGTWSATDLILGKFTFAKTVDGIDVLIREEAEIVGWDTRGRPWAESRRDAAKFMRYLRELARSNGHPVRDYFLGQPSIAPGSEDVTIDPSYQSVTMSDGTTAAAYQPAVNASALSYTMECGSGSGCRWASFGSGVPWYNQNTEPGAPNGGITAFQNALATWTNDCPSNINYKYGGQNPGAVGGLSASDGVNAIQFEMSLAQYGASPYVCGSGGTIALGGVTRASGSHNHPTTGETFISTQEGDVVSNVGLANCSTFLNSGDFVSGLVHELGHTLGFRHSNQDRAGSGACPAGYDCSSTAIMNSTLVRGLNGVLQAWDVNAASTVYPGGSCSAPPPPPPSPGSGVKGDFTRDSRPDLVLRNYTTGQNAVWVMNGTTVSGIVDLPALPNTSWRIEGTPDLNADGSSDLLLRNYSTGQNSVWLMSGTSLISIADLPSLPNTSVHFEGTADFTGDGRPDIMLRNYSTGQNAVWVMNGTSLMGVVDLPSLPNTSFRFESAADFTGDGRPDIVLRNYSSGQNALWVMNGTSLMGVVDLPALARTTFRIDAVQDFNADGSPDLVLRDYSTGQNAIWIMNGTSLARVADLPVLSNTSFEINGPR